MAGVVFIDATDVQLGGTDYSDEIAEATLVVDREALPFTNFASGGWREVTGGELSGTLNLTFNRDTDMSGLQSALWTAITAADATLTFDLQLDGDAAVGATNAAMQGSVLITQETVGAAVNQLWNHSVSWPVTGSITRDVTP